MSCFKSPRITIKERNLIKGAIRRVFSRSELRKKVIEKSIIVGYTDSSRGRVKTWCRCQLCKSPIPKSYMVVDHITPVIPINSSLEEITADELIQNIWCVEDNLQAICEQCHKIKTKLETKERTRIKRGKNVNKKRT